MNNEIPPRTTIAPIPIAKAVPLLSPLPPEAGAVGATLTGGAVVVVGELDPDCGSPGLSGFPRPCATAAPGGARTNATSAARRGRLTAFTLAAAPSPASRAPRRRDAPPRRAPRDRRFRR